MIGVLNPKLTAQSFLNPKPLNKDLQCLRKYDQHDLSPSPQLTEGRNPMSHGFGVWGLGGPIGFRIKGLGFRAYRGSIGFRIKD